MYDNITIKIGKKMIHRENHVRFLGVLLHFTLSWKTHITELSKKISRTVGLFEKDTMPIKIPLSYFTMGSLHLFSHKE